MMSEWPTKKDLLRTLVEFGIGRIIDAKWRRSPVPDFDNEILTPDEYKVAMKLSGRNPLIGVSDDGVVQAIKDAIADTEAEQWLRTNGLRISVVNFYVNGPSIHVISRSATN